MKTKSLPAALATALVLTAVLAGVLPRARAQVREEIDVSARGPQVGESIPDFTLSDQYGNPWTRDSILGPSGTMLVFIRSADW